MQADAILPEGVGEQDEVAQVAGQAIQPPHQHVRDVPLFHHRKELLKAGSLQVLARAPRVLDEDDRAEIMELGVGAELLGLAVDGDALCGLLLRRDPAIGNVQHSVVISLRLARRVAEPR